MIAPVIDPQTRYGLVYVDIPTTQAVRMGMFVKGEFDLGEKPALTIPQTALLLRDGFSYVFIVDQNNRVTQQKVTISRRLGDRVEIMDLPTQVKLVSSGTGFLTDGDLVTVAKDIPDTPLTKQVVYTQEKYNEFLCLVNPQSNSRYFIIYHARFGRIVMFSLDENTTIPGH